MLRLLTVLALLPFLAACVGVEAGASDADIERRAFRADGPPTLTLFTAINNRDGTGGHSALMVSGSQRVLFDPAGSWYHPTVPERGDVLYGITPTILDFYVDYHARPAFHMVRQDIVVPPEVAERALQLVAAHGPAARATCGQTVSGILQSLGFTSIRRAWYPQRIMHDFATLPGVTETKVFDDTVDESSPERPPVRVITDGGFEYES